MYIWNEYFLLRLYFQGLDMIVLKPLLRFDIIKFFVKNLPLEKLHENALEIKTEWAILKVSFVFEIQICEYNEELLEFLLLDPHQDTHIVLLLSVYVSDDLVDDNFGQFCHVFLFQHFVQVRKRNKHFLVDWRSVCNVPQSRVFVEESLKVFLVLFKDHMGRTDVTILQLFKIYHLCVFFQIFCLNAIQLI